MKNKQKKINDILLESKKDRRILSNVPDKKNIRSNVDRRGKSVLEDFKGSPNAFIESKKAGIRYIIKTKVDIIINNGKKKEKISAESVDISNTGILIKLIKKEDKELIKENLDNLILDFEIPKGAMPEGYEMHVKDEAKIVRQFERDNEYFIAFSFNKALSEYSRKKKDRYIIFLSSLALFFVSLFVILMRIESVIYFKFNKLVYLYSIIAAIFLLSRYFFGMLYKPIEIDMEFTPGVTIIIPCFNEEDWIDRTIISCINQDYPLDKLEVIIVDDLSTDKSVEIIEKTIEKLKKEAVLYDIEDRITLIPLKKMEGREKLCVKALK